MLEPVLAELGAAGLGIAARSLAELRAARGVALGSWTDGRHERHPVPLDPLPRLLPAARVGGCSPPASSSATAR